MKKILFILFAVLGLAITGFSQNQGNGHTNHECNGTSTLGGTCMAVCTIHQGCHCTTGWVECDCKCTESSSASSSQDPGPRENWELIKNLLTKESNTIAQELASEMMDVYYLAFNDDVSAYKQKIIILEQKFESLPSYIQQKLLNALDSRK